MLCHRTMPQEQLRCPKQAMPYSPEQRCVAMTILLEVQLGAALEKVFANLQAAAPRCAMQGVLAAEAAAILQLMVSAILQR